MKNYEAFFLHANMGDKGDSDFLQEFGLFIFENKQIKMIFGECTEEDDYIIILATAYDYLQMMKLFEDVTWEYSVRCITDELLRGDFNHDHFNGILKRPVNKRVINKFREANLTKDLILDIIYKKGIACLTPLELGILRNNENH
jgi:hypothetical protein